MTGLVLLLVVLNLCATAVSGQGIYGAYGPSSYGGLSGSGYGGSGEAQSAGGYGGSNTGAAESADTCAPGYYEQCQCSCIEAAQPVGMPPQIAPERAPQPEAQFGAPAPSVLSPGAAVESTAAETPIPPVSLCLTAHCPTPG